MSIVKDTRVYLERLEGMKARGANHMVVLRGDQPGYLEATGEHGPIRFYVLEKSGEGYNCTFTPTLVPNVKAEELQQLG